jgi:hypothetical protein
MGKAKKTESVSNAKKTENVSMVKNVTAMEMDVGPTECKPGPCLRE